MKREIDRNRLENLRRLLAEAGSAHALGLRTGTSGAYLSQIRSGTPYASGQPRRMGNNLAAKIERALGKPPGWMDEPHPEHPAGPDDAMHSPFTGCPLISWTEADAWTQASRFPDAEVRLHCPVPCAPGTFVLRVRGSSMEPRFQVGDLIFVDPCTSAHSGHYVVARAGAGAGVTFKQLVEEDGRRYLMAANPDWPQRIVELTSGAVVYGVVIFKGCAV